MTVTTQGWSRGTVARWAGGLYLAYILANVFASRVGDIGLSDAQVLRATISEDEARFRWGLVAALASALLFVLTAWALYVLLRPVDEPLALLLLVLNAVGVAVQCASYLPLLAVLAQADSAVNGHALTVRWQSSSARACLDELAELSSRMTRFAGGYDEASRAVLAHADQAEANVATAIRTVTAPASFLT